MTTMFETVVAIIAETRDNIFNAKVTPHTIIWTALQNAVETIDRLPDQERSWLRNDAKVWSMASLSPTEARQVAKSHLMAGIKPESYTALTSGTDLNHAMAIMDWFGFCRDGDDDSLQKAAYHLAGHRADAAAAHFRPGASADRKTLNHIKTLACVAILKRFKEDYGIEIANDGVIFVDSGL